MKQVYAVSLDGDKRCAVLVCERKGEGERGGKANFMKMEH